MHRGYGHNLQSQLLQIQSLLHQTFLEQILKHLVMLMLEFRLALKEW